MGKSRSHTDQAAIFQHAFNEEHGALEVVVVGSELKVDNMIQNILVDTSKMEAQLEKLVQKDTEKALESLADSLLVAFDHNSVQVIHVPQIIVQKEIQIVEVTKEIVREVRGPTKTEVVTVTVDREVIVTKTEYKDLSKLLIIGLVLQGLVNIIVALIHK